MWGNGSAIRVIIGEQSLFIIDNGLKQGDALVPLIFKISKRFYGKSYHTWEGGSSL